MNSYFIFSPLFNFWGILQTFVFVHILQDYKVTIPGWQRVSEATFSTETCTKFSAPKQTISASCKLKDRQLRFKTQVSNMTESYISVRPRNLLLRQLFSRSGGKQPRPNLPSHTTLPEAWQCQHSSHSSTCAHSAGLCKYAPN